jgi:hypothetical protein
MKRIALGLIATATLIGTPTLAADMTLPPRAAPPTVTAPAAGWTGFYLGGSFGGRFDGTKWNTTCIDPADPPGCPLGGGVNPLRLTNNNPATPSVNLVPRRHFRRL